MGAGLRDKEKASTKAKKQKRLLPSLHANMTQLTAGSPGNNKEYFAIFNRKDNAKVAPRPSETTREIGALS
jgi:hypothetical protein